MELSPLTAFDIELLQLHVTPLAKSLGLSLWEFHLNGGDCNGLWLGKMLCLLKGPISQRYATGNLGWEMGATSTTCPPKYHEELKNENPTSNMPDRSRP